MTEKNSPSPQSGLTTNSSTTASGLARKNTVSVGNSLHARLRNPTVDVNGDPLTKENRIALLLDVSGSMRNSSKIDCLRDACTAFVNNCTFSNTSVAIEAFQDDEHIFRTSLMCFQPFLMTTIQSLRAAGNTPMADAMRFVINNYSLTRVVIVSDGKPDNQSAAHDAAHRFAESSTPCDCVHVGDSSEGEICLQRIAEITGGKYIKFTDVQAFTDSFKYLTPAYYAQLTSGSVTAAQLGATEVK
jgi:Mg-chelatase subunit ChlD